MYGLRPLRLGEIFDAAIKITKAQPGRTFGPAALLFSSLAVLQWLDLLAVDMSRTTTPSLWGLFFAGTGRETPLFWAAVVIGLLALKPFVYDAVHETLIGTTPTPPRELLGRIPTLALSGAIYIVAVAAGLLLFIVPGLIAAALGAVAQPAVVNERQDALDALRRSVDLVKTDFARVIAFTATLWCFRVMAGLAVALALPGFLPYSLQPNSTRLMAVALTVIIATLVWPVTLAARAVLFTDLRVRAEALDVDLLIADATMVEDTRRRWAPS